MNLLKIFGWALLLLGVGIIVFSLYFAFLVSRGEKGVPQLFKIKAEDSVSKAPPKDLEEKVQRMILEQFQKILPKEEVSKLLNLITFSFFIGIFIFGGSQLANLGIKILKK